MSDKKTFKSFEEFKQYFFPKDYRKEKFDKATPEERGALIVEEAIRKVKEKQESSREGRH